MIDVLFNDVIVVRFWVEGIILICCRSDYGDVGLEEGFYFSD